VASEEGVLFGLDSIFSDNCTELGPEDCTFEAAEGVGSEARPPETLGVPSAASSEVLSMQQQ
jgi:hypothetical protein